MVQLKYNNFQLIKDEKISLFKEVISFLLFQMGPWNVYLNKRKHLVGNIQVIYFLPNNCK